MSKNRDRQGMPDHDIAVAVAVAVAVAGSSGKDLLKRLHASSCAISRPQRGLQPSGTAA
jgi:hypothetical protein